MADSAIRAAADTVFVNDAVRLPLWTESLRGWRLASDTMRNERCLRRAVSIRMRSGAVSDPTKRS